MASGGTLLPVLLVAVVLMAGGLVQGTRGESSSAVRRLLAGHNPLLTPAESCAISCLSSPYPTCCLESNGGPVDPSDPDGYNCVNTQKDIFNCGTCNNKCSGASENTAACCSGTCTDALTDPNNCGSCGKRCLGSDKCYAGLCNYAG